jgi:UDP-glucuronate 4-epimerase
VSRYLVTGCAGFIGSHLTESLLDAGHTVVGVDAFTGYYRPELKRRNLAGVRGRPGFRLTQMDIADGQLEPLLRGVDGIFHLAAQPGVRASWGPSFEAYVRHNLLASQRVVEAAASTGLRVVLASSSSVYGNALGYPTPEDAPPRPVSPYGVTKLAVEQLVSAYQATLGLDAVLLRYFSVYGPRQRPDMAFARIIGALREGTPFRVLGDGHQSRDFTYVGDAVEATVVAFERAPAGALYNVGGGTEASLLEVFQLMERLSERRLRKELRAAAAGDVDRTCADTSRIRTEIGWVPSIGLAEGLAAQIEAERLPLVGGSAARA